MRERCGDRFRSAEYSSHCQVTGVGIGRYRRGRNIYFLSAQNASKQFLIIVAGPILVWVRSESREKDVRKGDRKATI